MQLGKFDISRHALVRVRERWPQCNSLTEPAIKGQVRRQIYEAAERDDYVTAPGGVYFPITLMGQDGYAVLNKNDRGKNIITTVMPEKFCAHVAEIRRAKS